MTDKNKDKNIVIKTPLTGAVRIKKSCSVNVKNRSGWIGIEVEREFLLSEENEETQKVIDTVDILLSEEVRKMKNDFEDF